MNTVRMILCGNVEDSRMNPSEKVGVVSVVFVSTEEEKIKNKLKKLQDKNPEKFYIYITDPMLATGNSLIEAIKLYADKGIPIDNIKVICIIAAPQGIENIQKHYPNIEIITAAVDDCLNEKGYIVPGMGDAGDRIFGTK